jgi:diguanylate cyclase
MIDLDHFKSFNDKYGHLAGDDCLRRAAEAIAGVPQRPADVTARYGGEEMVVLLPNTDERGSAAVAQLIVQAVRDMRLPHESNPAGIVTISCGVAAFTPDEDAQVAVMLLERADQALYAAKIHGRNQVASHEDMSKPGRVGVDESRS